MHPEMESHGGPVRLRWEPGISITSTGRLGTRHCDLREWPGGIVLGTLLGSGIMKATWTVSIRRGGTGGTVTGIWQ